MKLGQNMILTLFLKCNIQEDEKKITETPYKVIQ